MYRGHEYMRPESELAELEDAERTEERICGILSRNGLELKHIPYMKRTLAVCRAAVGQNPKAMRWVPEEIRTAMETAVNE